jgi:hypothetical protein
MYVELGVGHDGLPQHIFGVFVVARSASGRDHKIAYNNNQELQTALYECAGRIGTRTAN